MSYSLRIAAFEPPYTNTIKSCYDSATKNTLMTKDSGVDLYFLEDIVVPADARAFPLHTHICCEVFKSVTWSDGGTSFNSGYWLLPRSSISKTPLRMSNSVGVMDAGYRGETIAKVDNLSDEPFVIAANTRLFQLVSPDMSPMNVNVVAKLSESVRGTGGFGSTGE